MLNLSDSKAPRSLARLPAALGACLVWLGWVCSAHAQASHPLEGLQRDLAQYRKGFLALDRSYTAAARQSAEARLAKLETELAGMDPPRFELMLAQITALADNAHTASSVAARSRRYARVQMRLAPFGEEMVVVRTLEADADLLGARLVSVDGVPMQTLRPLYRSLAGGTVAWRDRFAPYFLESPPQLRALGVGQGDDPPVYGFVGVDGKATTRSFAVSAPGGARALGGPTRFLMLSMDPKEAPGWRALLAVEQVPWTLQEPDKRLRMRHDRHLDAVFIDLRQTLDSDSEPLAPFFAAVTRLIEEKQPQHLVLDLRLNSGGDLTKAREFAQSLPSKVPGRIFALTSPWTFSAAISTLGYLKQAAPERVRIVGEAVGDRLEFFAEGRWAVLPHSGDVHLFSTERHEYRQGCAGHRDCHKNVVTHPIAVESLAPDILAPWTVETYRAGQDPALEAVARALGRTP
ncbi:MAG: hypothetical protein J0L58_16935 [Burkholderiales bacterium]|nr:hypothetical protein [Burkholderiales bacterium]